MLPSDVLIFFGKYCVWHNYVVFDGSWSKFGSSGSCADSVFFEGQRRLNGAHLISVLQSGSREDACGYVQPLHIFFQNYYICVLPISSTNSCSRFLLVSVYRAAFERYICNLGVFVCNGSVDVISCNELNLSPEADQI